MKANDSGETVTFRIPAALKEAIVRAAEADRRSLTSYVCKALRLAMEIDGIEREARRHLAEEIKVRYGEDLRTRIARCDEELRQRIRQRLGEKSP